MWMRMVVARQATELHASVHQSASNGKVQLVRPKFLRVQARTGAVHTHCGAYMDCRGRRLEKLGVDCL
jgi:hypothetical protein